MKARLSESTTQWNLERSLECCSTGVLHFPSSLKPSTRKDHFVRAIPAEQNIFKMYFGAYRQEHGQAEGMAYLTLWLCALLTIGVALFGP